MFFERGAACFCAPVEQVQAIVQVGDVHAPPFRRKGIAGVFMFRGRVALLFDPGAALALKTEDESAAATLAIVVAFPEGTVAFRVDRVSEIVPAASLQRPAGEHNAMTAWMNGYAMQGSQIAFLTTFEKLMHLLIEADPGSGLAAVIGAGESVAASRLAGHESLPAPAPAPPPEPARIAIQKAVAQAPAVAKPPSRAAAVRPAIVPVRAPAVRARPVRAASTRPPASFAYRRIASPSAEPPEAELRDSLPIEPVELKRENLAQERRPGPAPLPASDAASAPIPATEPSVRLPLVPAPHIEPQSIPAAQPDDRAPPARRHFALALAAGILLALALGAFLLPDWGGKTTTRRTQVPTAAPAAAIAEPSERPAGIAIVGRDFELRVERGAANTPAAPAAATGEIRHIVARGDTLWAIATRYLGNPYRYPELAQNSRIRNPDLIRPGDVVVIVRRLRQQPN